LVFFVNNGKPITKSPQKGYLNKYLFGDLSFKMSERKKERKEKKK
jgi:hypothetical protein